MTLDEAITHAREVSKEQRELFSLCSYPSQECDGTKTCKCIKNEHIGCIKCAEEHEQLADWLSELKEMRASQGKVCDLWYLKGREDAIDDECNTDDYETGYTDAFIMLNEIHKPYVNAINKLVKHCTNKGRAEAIDERASLLAFICKKYNISLLDMNSTVDEWEQLKESK